MISNWYKASPRERQDADKRRPDVTEEIEVVVGGLTFDLRVVWDDGSEREYTGVKTSAGVVMLGNDDEFGIMIMQP